jgi:hypothetical protein
MDEGCQGAANARRSPVPQGLRSAPAPVRRIEGSLVYAALVSGVYARQYAARVREQSARAARAELLQATAESTPATTPAAKT